MYTLSTIVFLSTLLTSCSVETMNVGDGKDESSTASDGPDEQQPAPSTGEAEEPTVEDEYDPETLNDEEEEESDEKEEADNKPANKSSAERAIFNLVNKNSSVDKFVSQNFCRGSNLHDCWIKSGKMTETENPGIYVVSIEFWNTQDTEEPYKVFEATISTEGTILLTDSAKIPDDDGLEFRFLWAVVDPVAKTLEVVYDYGSDGPQEQGDDLLQSMEFKKAGG